MALITWNDSMSTKVAEMDQQHKQIINLINELHTAMTTGHGKERSTKILLELKLYVQSHFTREEAFMQKISFPGFARHKQLHDQLTQQVLGLEKRIMAGEQVSSSEVLDFLRGWLSNHIEQEDKKYGVHATQKTLAKA